MGTITLNKNSGATILEIRNFSNLTTDENIPVEVIQEIESDASQAKLLKILGNIRSVSFEWTLTEEATSVVTGTGSPVTTAIGQFKYLYDTFRAPSIADCYTLTIDFGGGVTWPTSPDNKGIVSKIATIMTSDQPITFKGNMTFTVGTCI